MKLIDTQTRKELKVGDSVVTFRGEEYTLRGFSPPRHASSTGRVYINRGSEYDEEYFPNVINAKFEGE